MLSFLQLGHFPFKTLATVFIVFSFNSAKLE